MTKCIDLYFTAPPSMDAPTYIQAADGDGLVLNAGKWLPPDDGAPCWRLRFSVAELVVLLVAPGSDVSSIAETVDAVDAKAEAGVAGMHVQQQQVRVNRGIAARQALKANLPSRPQRNRAPQPAAPVQEPYDPDEDTSLSPEELDAPPEEGGFDPSAVPDDPATRRALARADQLEGSSKPPFHDRLFDNVHHGKGGDSAADENDE